MDDDMRVTGKTPFWGLVVTVKDLLQLAVRQDSQLATPISPPFCVATMLKQPLGGRLVALLSTVRMEQLRGLEFKKHKFLRGTG